MMLVLQPSKRFSDRFVSISDTNSNVLDQGTKRESLTDYTGGIPAFLATASHVLHRQPHSSAVFMLQDKNLNNSYHTLQDDINMSSFIRNICNRKGLRKRRE